jgi:hypothetical protein
MKKFKKFNKIQIRWNEPLGIKECPYAYRWVFNFHIFTIRIHHFIRSDDKRYFHDHGWNFITLVLKGSYVDVSPDGRDYLKRGSLRYRKATHRHYVEVPKEGCWTFLITGPLIRKWGFWIREKFKRPLKYFHKWGHPPCSEQ